jgi:hypothetical protein
MKQTMLVALGITTTLTLFSCRTDWVCNCRTRPGLPDSTSQRHEFGKINGQKAIDKCKAMNSARDTCETMGFK